MTITTSFADVKQADLRLRTRRLPEVTFLTVEARMLPHEREFTIAAVVEGQTLPPPALHRMAFKALAGAWVVVRVVVTTRATRVVEPDILHSAGRMRTGPLFVTLLAWHGLVFAVEREVGAVVVECLPVQRYQGALATVLRMALPARAGETAVHTRSGGHALPDPGVADEALLRGRRRRQQMAIIAVSGARVSVGEGRR